MKNIFGTQEEIKLYDDNGVLRYKYKNYKSFQHITTYDSNGYELTFENSYGWWSKWTRDEQGNEITYENSYGERRGFNTPEYTMEELTKMIGKEFKIKK